MDDFSNARLSKPLPKTREELTAARKVAPIRSLNDAIDDLVVELWGDPDYQKLIEATYDEQAVEGSLAADNILAAKMLRDVAISKGLTLISRQKLATISKAHGVVLRRYAASRKERRFTVHGTMVTPDTNGQE